jgi:hypothetical protein
VGEAVGFADLPEDFRFTEEERVESGGDAEEMTDSGAIVMLIEGDTEDVRANGMEFAKKGREAACGLVGGFGGNAVEFAAIAGGEDEGLFEEATGAKFRSGAPSLVGSERDALAQFEWRGAVI